MVSSILMLGVVGRCIVVSLSRKLIFAGADQIRWWRKGRGFVDGGLAPSWCWRPGKLGKRSPEIGHRPRYVIEAALTKR